MMVRCAHEDCGQLVYDQRVAAGSSHLADDPVRGVYEVIDTVYVTNLPCGHSRFAKSPSEAVVLVE